MDSKTRTLIITGSILVFVVVPVATALVLTMTQKKESSQQKTANSPLPDRSDTEITNAIISKTPSLAQNGKATFTVMSTKKLKDGWYVTTIRDNSDATGANAAKVLLHNSRTSIEAILGPGTSFDQTITQDLGIPSEIAQELNS